MASAIKNITRFRRECARLSQSMGSDNDYYGYPEVKACIVTLRYNLLYEDFDQDPLETLLQIELEPYREFKFENPNRVNIRQVMWTHLPWQLIKVLFNNIQAEINKIKELEDEVYQEDSNVEIKTPTLEEIRLHQIRVLDKLKLDLDEIKLGNQSVEETVTKLGIFLDVMITTITEIHKLLRN